MRLLCPLLLLFLPPILSHPILPLPQPQHASTPPIPASKVAILYHVVNASFAEIQHSANSSFPTLRQDISDPTLRQTAGLTFDPCSVDSDCVAPRTCLADSDEDFEFDGPCLPDSDFCSCLQVGAPQCSDSTDCIDEEVCAVSLFIPDPICYSREGVMGENSFVLPFDSLEGGVNGDVCENEDDCRGARLCAEDNIESTDCRPGRECFCFPLFTPTCSTDDECDEGEECRDTGLENRVCFTLAEFNSVDGVPEELDEPEQGPVIQRPNPSSEESPNPTSGDLDGMFPETDMSPTGEPVDTAEDTTEPMDTAEASSAGEDTAPAQASVTTEAMDTTEVTASGEGTMGGEAEMSAEAENVGPMQSGEAGRLPLLVSQGETEGESEIMASMSPEVEVAVSIPPVVGNAADGEGTVEISEDEAMETEAEAEAEATETAAPICVDVELLRGFSREEMVFEEDRVARVWCDVGGNCATGGHMVVWEGRAMMMKRYCGLVEGGCVRRDKLVNSPKWRVGRRVRGWQEGGVEFTTFAARWETRVEERVLAGVVRMGL